MFTCELFSYFDFSTQDAQERLAKSFKNIAVFDSRTVYYWACIWFQIALRQSDQFLRVENLDQVRNEEKRKKKQRKNETGGKRRKEKKRNFLIAILLFFILFFFQFFIQGKKQNISAFEDAVLLNFFFHFLFSCFLFLFFFFSFIFSFLIFHSRQEKRFKIFQLSRIQFYIPKFIFLKEESILNYLIL